MIDKHCTREQVQKLLSLGIERKYSRVRPAHMASSADFYFWELMDYLPDTIQKERYLKLKNTWFFEIRREGGSWDIGYVDVNAGGEPIQEVMYSNENPAIAAADLLIYLKENNYV